MTREEAIFFESHLREMLVFVSTRKIEEEREQAKIIDFRKSFSIFTNHGGDPSLIGANAAQKEEVKEKQKEKKGECNQKSAETETKKEEKEVIRFSDCKIRKRKNGLYEIRYRRGGINKTWSAMKLKEAKKRCLSWLSSENRRRRELAEEGFAPDALIFKDFADNFLYNVKKRMVKPKTFEAYENVYKNHIVPNFGKMPLDGIKAMYVQQVLNSIHEKAPRTCEDVKILLNSIFTYAVNNGEIKINPVKAVYIPKHERKNGEALTKSEEAEFLKALQGKKIELTYILALYTGARACEVNTAVFDVEKNTVTFKNGKLKSYQKEKFRTIPIFPKLKPYVPRFLSEDWQTSQDRITHSFRELFPGTSHSFKDLRHTFTTRARECGVDNEVVSVWTGHSLGNITARVYTHFSPEFMQREAEKLNYSL